MEETETLKPSCHSSGYLVKLSMALGGKSSFAGTETRSSYQWQPNNAVRAWKKSNLECLALIHILLTEVYFSHQKSNQRCIWSFYSLPESWFLTPSCFKTKVNVLIKIQTCTGTGCSCHTAGKAVRPALSGLECTTLGSAVVLEQGQTQVSLSPKLLVPGKSPNEKPLRTTTFFASKKLDHI